MVSRVTRLGFVLWFVLVCAAMASVAARGWTPLAGVGLALLFFLHPALLAAEFLLARRVSRRASGPRVAPLMLLRAWVGEWRGSTTVFGWRLPWRVDATPDHLPPDTGGRRAVVFLHGFICNRGIWNPWLARLRALDRPFVAVNLEPVFGPIDGYADLVEAAVRRATAATGRPPLIVAHSMGGLVARAWMRAYPAGVEQRVCRVVTIGTPHRGTWMAGLSMSPNGRQMRLDSDWMRSLAASENPVRRALFTCWWSACDQIVFPPPTAVLEGGRQIEIEGTAHVRLCDREEIWRDLLAQLDA